MSWRDKRVAGIVLILVGLIFLAFGYLFNNSVPGSLQRKLLDDLCVSGVKHPSYQKWINVSESTTKIYYWHIKNKEGFLYRREIPQLEERGPYVYTTTSRRVAVKFDALGKVTYKNFKKQKFNKETTAKLCPTCQENDQLNVINLAHLGLMNKVKTADAFSWVFIPVALNSLLRDMDSKLGDRNATLIELGKLNSFLPQVNGSVNPAFGSWLKSKPDYKGILRMRRMTCFTLLEMRGLYSALVDPSILGPPQDKLVYANCTVYAHLEGCGLIMWLKNYLLAIKNPNVTSQTFNKSEARRLIEHAFCPSRSSCLVVNDSLLAVLMDFVNSALRGYVLWSMDHNNYGLLSPRPQRDLALGYVMDKFRHPPEYLNGVPSPGALKSHSSLNQAVERSDSTTLHSCNSSSPGEYRFTWAAYNGASKVDKAFYPNATEAERKVRGHHGLFFPAKDVNACGTNYDPATEEYEVFIAHLKQRTKFVFEKPIVSKDLKLQRYKLDKGLVTTNNRTVFSDGLLDQSGVYGFPLLLSFPRFLHGERGLGQRLGLPAGDPEKHGSFMDIEPFSGSALHAVIRFQVNTVVNSGFVKSQVHPRPLNVSYVEDNSPFYRNVIPVFWTETTAEISDEQATEMSEKIFGALGKSCVLTIVMSTVAALCLFFGMILVTLSIRRGNAVSVEVSEST